MHVRKDSQGAIKRVQHMVVGLGKWLTRRIIAKAQQLTGMGVEVEIHWVSGHIRVNGNEQVDRAAKEEVRSTGIRRVVERFTLLSHVN